MTATGAVVTHRDLMKPVRSSEAEQAADLLRGGRAREAADLLQHALQRGHDPAAARLRVKALVAAQDLIAALDCQRTLVPTDIAGCDGQGRADALAAAQLAQLAMFYEEAAQIARQLVKRDPADTQAVQLLASLDLWLHGPEAAQAAWAGVALEDLPPHLLAETLAFHDDPPEELLERAAALAHDASLGARDRASLYLALAQHFDSKEDFDAAWHHAQRGNALLGTGAPQDWRAVLRAHVRIYEDTPPVPQAPGPAHLYLLGTPRSGQSLLQSVLGASPRVASAGERGALLQHLLPNTLQLARMGREARSGFFSELASADQRGLARLYAGAELAVDKSPFHLPIAGSIARIHPTARFAAVARDPLDTALSIWLRNFPPIYDYANDLGAIFAYLGFAMDALERWRDAGLPIRLIDHAAFVADPGGESAALFEWLDLPWQKEFLATGNRTQPVPTFSAAQVRRSISPARVRTAAAYETRMARYAETIAELRRRKSALLSQDK